jgi:hypothetical protein
MAKKKEGRSVEINALVKSFWELSSSLSTETLDSIIARGQQELFERDLVVSTDNQYSRDINC